LRVVLGGKETTVGCYFHVGKDVEGGDFGEFGGVFETLVVDVAKHDLFVVAELS
jgi:hypothetical protein